MSLTDSASSKVKLHAYNRLGLADRLNTNLYLDQSPYEEGQLIGPEFQKLTAPSSSYVVFADPAPHANFGHDCHYWLYDVEGNPKNDLQARFPPARDPKRTNLEAFHHPVSHRDATALFSAPLKVQSNAAPATNKFAILYGGMSNMRHLNDLEFCYRMLVNKYNYLPGNIVVCNFDGTLDTQDGPGVSWAGDSTPFQIKVQHPGNQQGFQTAIADIKGRLDSNSLLFIHSNNHGDNSGSGSFLCAYPNWGTYMATDFVTDLGAIPSIQDLVIMMEQCNSGGFQTPVLGVTVATNVCLACAADSTHSSYATADGNWDCFARDWIGAQMGVYPNGGALASNPDTDGDGIVSAAEAFNYANANRNAQDTPNYVQNCSAAGAVGL